MKLIAKDGWDLQVRDNILYFRTNDAQGENRHYYKFDSQEITEIEFNDFMKVKLGEHFQQIFDVFNGEPSASVLLSDGRVIATEYTNFIIHIFDSDGKLLRRIDNIGFDATYHIAFEPPDFLWCVFSYAYAVRKYCIETTDVESGIGFYNEAIFQMPERIAIYESIAYVCDAAQQKIIQLKPEKQEDDSINYHAETYKQFTEPVYDFARIGNIEFVELRSGVYQI